RQTRQRRCRRQGSGCGDRQGTRKAGRGREGPDPVERTAGTYRQFVTHGEQCSSGNRDTETKTRTGPPAGPQGNKMKSPMSKWLSLGALAMALASPFSSAVADTKSVAATAIVEHPALDSVRDGVRAALEEAGYTVGDNLKWQYQTAQGNTATAGQIARKFVGDKPDVIVAIATPSAQAVVASTKSIPVVFAAVTDPLA